MSWAGYKHYFIVDTESHRTSANRKESLNGTLILATKCSDDNKDATHTNMSHTL